MSTLPPCVVEDEYVISADAQDDEESEDVENSEVSVVEDDAVDEVGGEEAEEDAENAETGDEDRPGLNAEERPDEEETSAKKHDVRLNGFLDERPKNESIEVEKFDSANQTVFEGKFKVVDHFRHLFPRNVLLFVFVDVITFESSKRPTNREHRTNRSSSHLFGTDHRVCVERELDDRLRDVVCVPRSIQNEIDVLEVGVIEDRIVGEREVGSIEETEDGERFGALIVCNQTQVVAELSLPQELLLVLPDVTQAL